MTIIASYQHHNHIFVVGDLLVSGLDRGNSVKLPTRLYQDQPPIPKHFVELCQKVVCIDDNLIAAWAGSKVIAKFLVSLIAKEIKHPYSADQILGLIYSSELSEKELNEVSFIFYGIHRNEENGESYQFVQDYLTGQTIIGKDRKIKYSGSGQYHFLECLNFTMKGYDGAVGEPIASASWMIARMATALLEELMSEGTHNFSYGGGFEIVWLDHNEKIAKIPITFVFWKFNESGLDLIGPILAFNYQEQNKLVINRFNRSEISQDWELSKFHVGDLLSSPSHIENYSLKPNFDTYFTVHYFLSENRCGPVKIMIKWGKEKNVKLNYLSENNSIEVEYSKEFLEEVRVMTIGV